MTKDEQSQTIVALTSKVDGLEYNMKEAQIMILSLLEKVEELQMVLVKNDYALCTHSSVSELKSIQYMKRSAKRKLD